MLQNDLTPQDRHGMFALFTRYYAGVSRSVFERDLAEKEWVIVMRDSDTTIAGFSTLTKFVHGGRTVFFSGDTIVAEHRRGSADLARLWVRQIRAEANGLGRDVYWFLISSGYRTYRFLPVFFRDFYPHYAGASSPELKALLDAIAIHRFGDLYDPGSGIVRLPTPSPLRDTSACDERAEHDPHVRFFLSANAGHARGDELACLVRVSEDNLTPAGIRMLR